MSRVRAFRNFTDFYPFYLGEHRHPTCRRLHFVGTTLAAALLLTAVLTRHWGLLLVALIEAYGCAWVGHFFFEHNRPATFKHPVFSFMGDWRMWWDILRGRQQIRAAGPNSSD